MDSVSFCRATFLGMKSAEVRACARMRWDRQAQRLPVAVMVKGALKEGPCRCGPGDTLLALGSQSPRQEDSSQAFILPFFLCPPLILYCWAPCCRLGTWTQEAGENDVRRFGVK